jgi:hypothetical protein
MAVPCKESQRLTIETGNKNRLGKHKGVSACSAGAHTAILYVMVTIVKGGGRAPPTLISLD